MSLSSRRRFIQKGSTLVAATALPGAALWPGLSQAADEVKLGLLHSMSGTIALAEAAIVDAEKMAIDEINAAGGIEVDGKKYKIDYIVEDGASDWPTFAEKSKKLIDQDEVPVVFGGWTSASRKAMLPVYESKDAFLYYPIQYEAQECSNNIFYTGATPNQQSEPATKFMYEKSPAAGKPFFLVGSDYVFPRTSNTITKSQVAQLGGTVVGEDYLPLGNTEVAPIIAKIKKALPDGGVIINTASTAALGPMPTDPIYAGTKAAVVNLTQSCAGLSQSHNIRVNAVLPGMVATPFIEKTGDGEQPAAWLKPILGQIPMLSADQIAEGIIQLVLDQSSAGACLVIENPTKPGGPPLKTLLPDAKSFYRYQLSR